MRKHNTLCHSDPDKWFRGMPVNTTRGPVVDKIIKDCKEAIRICEDCPVNGLCRELGMQEDNLEHGIWGGLLAGERLLEAGITPPLPNEPNRKRDTQAVRSAFSLMYAVKPWTKVEQVA